jgi:hypothetical protein
VFLDYDNDADLDLTIANGHVLDNTREFRSTSKHAQRKLLLRNDGTGKLKEVGLLSGRGFATETVGRTLVAGDIDNDGDVDLLVTNNGQPADLVRNDGGNRNNAVLVRVIGKESNRDGIGTRIRATTGARTQVREVKAGSSYLGQNDVRVHFGLNRATRIDRLEVRWPSGRVEVIQNIPANHIVTLVEGEGATTHTPFVRRG